LTGAMEAHFTVAASSADFLFLRNLRVFSIHGCELSDEGVAGFAAALQRHGLFPQLRQLSIVDNRLSDLSLGELAKMFASGGMPELVHLNLASNDVTDAGCTLFASAIANGALAKLLHLSLARNQVGDAGLVALAQGMQATRCQLRLQYLGLGDNLIGNDGLVALSRAILQSGSGLSKLAGLWLADNEAIADEGIIALASAIQVIPIQNLYLQNTSMSQIGWQAIVCSLPFCSSLNLLVLGRVAMEMHKMLDWTLQTIREREHRELSVCYQPPLADGGKPIKPRSRRRKATPSPLSQQHHAPRASFRATAFVGGVVTNGMTD